ncbi:glutathione S-transferase family protein [Sinimarinibacterium thermocellulolyticum]|uniref:Glutathione S-transferase N-terminal domain-containing protein n=1 Tax=Sinimarinibacterium thermocellulolyticum TaxID=3170016 RepID=A0ABV2A7L3_9GAMM
MNLQRTEPLLLFGAPVGMYTGKVRSYLRKNGIPYSERLPSDPIFQKQLLPRLKRFINPVIRMPDGTVVQDTADIIDFLEARGLARHPSTPATPRQRIVALILDLYGSDGLVRPAMHYRWGYRDQNEAFLRHEFGLSYRPGRAAPEVVEQQLGNFMNYLHSHLPNLGIDATTALVIEACYEELLTTLDAHLRAQPYALGGLPTIADYGLMAPLYAHLARDPVPATLMKSKAPSLYRWTERMNAPDHDAPEFPHTPYALPDDDAVPDTLRPLLRQIATDFVPEVEMTVRALDRWWRAHGHEGLVGQPAERGLVRDCFTLRGTPVTTVVAPYLIYKLQRVTDAWDALDDAGRASVAAFVDGTGLEPLLTLKPLRRIERREFLEVWGAATA